MSGEYVYFLVSPATLADRVASAPMIGQGATLFIALCRRVEKNALQGGADRKCGLQIAGVGVLRAENRIVKHAFRLMCIAIV
ncbi:hypothetical protein IG631_09179 [Alternaria alternata]|jgi:hypothetical protein|nr:hypothetical protein IG631_09179 [Alternaria alternata]